MIKSIIRLTPVCTLFFFLVSCTVDQEKVNQYDTNGNKIGKWVELDEEGDTVRFEIYNDLSKMEYGIVKIEEGKKIESFYSDGELNRQVYYYASGAVESDTQYKGEVQDGLQVVYLEDGSKQIESNFKDGDPQGLFRQYYPNGKLNFESENFGNSELKVYDTLGNLIKGYIYQDFVVVDSVLYEN